MEITVYSEPTDRQATVRIKVDCYSQEYWRLIRLLMKFQRRNDVSELEDDDDKLENYGLPTVNVGEVHPIPSADLHDKEFPKKVLEEAAEVYSAWENIKRDSFSDAQEILHCKHLILECTDVIQTAVNMVYAANKRLCEIDVERDASLPDRYDLRKDMEITFRLNRAKGLYDTAEED